MKTYSHKSNTHEVQYLNDVRKQVRYKVQTRNQGLAKKNERSSIEARGGSS